ncbi:NAD(P)H-binding protein [Paenibacillus sp. HJL G12]|uniref:NAD(P)H-binding protein n=1 Tax=Paenibacillus dendrobii TaxID=2691084 RepID=A0A7X3IKS6_9BACL|nr:NAD(P)H-binding protein [Paenibacillus dendrobii]
MGLQALVLGATGLVGGEVVQELLRSEAYSLVRVLSRRPLGFQHPKLQETIIDLEQLEEHAEHFSGMRDVFCCLGTTIRKAGSQVKFRKVDLEYPLRAAKVSKQQGVKQFLAVSAMGADPTSRIFYNRVKGEAEQVVSSVGLHGVHWFRPSLLIGDRKEFRFGESAGALVMKGLDPLMRGRASKYRAMPAATLARAMVSIALTGTAGTHAYPNDVIHVLGTVPAD